MLLSVFSVMCYATDESDTEAQTVEDKYEVCITNIFYDFGPDGPDVEADLTNLNGPKFNEGYELDSYTWSCFTVSKLRFVGHFLVDGGVNSYFMRISSPEKTIEYPLYNYLSYTNDSYLEAYASGEGYVDFKNNMLFDIDIYLADFALPVYEEQNLIVEVFAKTNSGIYSVFSATGVSPNTIDKVSLKNADSIRCRMCYSEVIYPNIYLMNHKYHSVSFYCQSCSSETYFILPHEIQNGACIKCYEGGFSESCYPAIDSENYNYIDENSHELIFQCYHLFTTQSFGVEVDIGCGDVSEIQPHTVGDDGYCACGYHEHVWTQEYLTYKYTDTVCAEIDYKCWGCDEWKTETVPHEYLNCQCTICAFSKEHNFVFSSNSRYVYEEDCCFNKIYDCSDCVLEEYRSVNHTYINGECTACGYVDVTYTDEIGTSVETDVETEEASDLKDKLGDFLDFVKDNGKSFVAIFFIVDIFLGIIFILWWLLK